MGSKSKDLKSKSKSKEDLKSKKSKDLKSKKSKDLKSKRKSKDLKSKSKSKDLKSKKSKKSDPKPIEGPTIATTEPLNVPTSAPTFSKKSVAAARKAFNILNNLNQNLLPYYGLLLSEFHAFLDDFVASTAVIEEELERVFAPPARKRRKRLKKTRNTQSDYLADVIGIIASAFDALDNVLKDIPGVDLGDFLAVSKGLLKEFEDAVGEFTNPPTESPTELPTEVPTEGPPDEPTEEPEVPTTEVPTEGPTDEPTEEPTDIPAPAPSSSTAPSS